MSDFVGIGQTLTPNILSRCWLQGVTLQPQVSHIASPLCDLSLLESVALLAVDYSHAPAI
jgi:hypothetical protein